MNKRLYAGISAVSTALLMALAACGDDSSSGTDGKTVTPDFEVQTFDDLGTCTTTAEGNVGLVKDDNTTYTCQSGEWVKDGGKDSGKSDDKKSEGDKGGKTPSGNDIGSSNSSGSQDSGVSAPAGQSSGPADAGASGSSTPPSGSQDSNPSAPGSGTAGAASDSSGTQQVPSGPAEDASREPASAPAQASTDVPPIVRPPEATPTPTAVPAPIQPVTPESHPSAGQPTAQPDLQEAVQHQNSSAPAAGGSEKNEASGSSGSRGSSGGSVKPSGRDLKKWPVFSARFPWRRLRMNPEAGIQVRIAGILLWPQPEAASPLMNLIQQSSGNPDT